MPSKKNTSKWPPHNLPKSIFSKPELTPHANHNHPFPSHPKKALTDADEPPTKRPKFDHSNIWKPTLTDRPLASNMPKTAQTRDINTWLTQIKNDLPDKSDHKQFDAYIAATEKAFKDIDKSQRPSIKDIACQWGLPYSEVESFTQPGLLKISAGAAFLAAAHAG